MTTLPKLPSGATGFYNERNKWQCTGSQMGRRDTLPENRQAKGRLRLVRLKWISGDYDQGGAYWGAPALGSAMFTWIYRALGDMDGEEFTTELFVRAKGRLEELILAQLPNATFFN